MVKTSITIASFEDGGRWPELRNITASRSRKSQGHEFSPRASRKGHSSVDISILAQLNLCQISDLQEFKIMNLFFFFFLWPHLWHVEVAGPGAELELQLQAYAIATAKLDPSCISDLHCTLWQHQIFNSLSEARDQTHSHRHYIGFLTH